MGGCAALGKDVDVFLGKVSAALNQLRPCTLEYVYNAPVLGKEVSAALDECFKFGNCIITELMAARPVLIAIDSRV